MAAYRRGGDRRDRRVVVGGEDGDLDMLAERSKRCLQHARKGGLDVRLRVLALHDDDAAAAAKAVALIVAAPPTCAIGAPSAEIMWLLVPASKVKKHGWCTLAPSSLLAVVRLASLRQAPVSRSSAFVTEWLHGLR